MHRYGKFMYCWLSFSRNIQPFGIKARINYIGDKYYSENCRCWRKALKQKKKKKNVSNRNNKFTIFILRTKIAILLRDQFVLV